MSKAHASHDEMLLLVRLKREQAKRALNQVIERLSGNSDSVPPDMAILDYLMNMVSAIELVLKLLASNWTNHNVGKMYEQAFGSPYAKSDLMARIEEAIMDQKYLLQPSSGLLERIPEMECLFENLQEQIRGKQPRYHVDQDIEVPRTFVEYLRDNVGVYYSTPLLQDITGEEVQALWREEVRKRQEAISDVLKRIPQIRFRRTLGSLT